MLQRRTDTIRRHERRAASTVSAEFDRSVAPHVQRTIRVPRSRSRRRRHELHAAGESLAALATARSCGHVRKG